MIKKNRIIKCLESVFTSNNLTEESNSENTLGWDSVGTINLVMEIEKEFKIKIKSNEIINIQSYSNIKSILTKKGIKID